MSDLAIAALIMGFLIGLAITAPIWGYDSRDGIESDQTARRAAWMHPHNAGFISMRSHGIAGTTQAAGLLVAGVLRSAAYRLDADAATDERVNGRAAGLC
jgi:hypothetical protein